jgi:hypothetical protein
MKKLIAIVLVTGLLTIGFACDSEDAAEVKDDVSRAADKTGDVVDKAIDKTGEVVGTAVEKAANTKVKVDVDVTTRPAATAPAHAPSTTTNPL